MVHGSLNMQSHQANPPSKKHSGIGIASFIIGIISFLAYIGIIITAVGLIVNFKGDLESISSVQPNDIGALAIVGFLVIIVMLVNVTGLILGIVSVRIRNSKKSLAIAGLIINGLLVIFIVMLYIISVVKGN